LLSVLYERKREQAGYIERAGEWQREKERERRAERRE